MTINNSQLTPIETEYKGYKFRSRLEARWAVFFDTLSLVWQYEPEGFSLKGPWYFKPEHQKNDNIWYLPDFYIKDWGCWVEIKPDAPTNVEMMLCHHLSMESGKKVLLISGSPTVLIEDSSYNVFCFYPEKGLASDLIFGHARRCEDEMWLIPKDYMDWNSAVVLNPVRHNDAGRYPIVGERISTALSAAQSAQFEHLKKK